MTDSMDSVTESMLGYRRGMGEKLKLIVVDDEQSIRNGLCSAIDWSAMGIVLSAAAADGDEAFDLIALHEPDIVICDIKMPRMDGLELIEKVKRLGLDTQFIILSGHAEFAFAQKAIAFGVSSYLLKPISTEELLREVASLKRRILDKESIAVMGPAAVEQGLQALRERFLFNLVNRGFKSQADLDLEARRIHIALPEGPIRVAVFDSDAARRRESGILGEIKGALLGTFSEACGNTLFEVEGGLMAAVLRTGRGLDDYRASVEAAVLACGQEIYCGMGQIVDSPRFAFDSYRSAIEALSYRLYDDRMLLVDSSIIRSGAAPKPSSCDNYSKAICEAVLSGDSSLVERETEQFFLSLFYTEMPPPSYLRGMCIYLIIAVQKGIDEYIVDSEAVFDPDPGSSINALASFKDMKRYVFETFQEYLIFAGEKHKVRQSSAVEKAKEYIRDNVAKKILLEDVAAAVNLSESYLAALFKAQTGENFRNYFLKLKIEEAKRQLRDSALSIGEIADLLGYEDYRSFNRAFKRDAGRTPSEYRNSYYRSK